VHEASRGKKKLSLADLSKQLPSEEQLEQYPDFVILETDRGSAIMASALLEQALKTAICCRITDHGDDVRKAWFEGDNAPFGTFAAKIQLGMALGIYGPVMHGQLIRIKNIRNQFAHCSVPLDFSNPVVRDEVKKLRPDPLIGDSPIKTRFVSTCLGLAQLLATDSFEQGGKEMVIRFP
jgi:hypothetical protein